MIYVIRSYEVHDTDVATFTKAFDEDGPWQRLSYRMDGHLHTGLLVGSILPPSFLSLAIWQSERHFLAAENTSEFISFNRSLRLLSVSYQAAGMFRYRYRPEKDAIQSYAVRIPAPANKTPALHYILESDFDDEVLRQNGPVLVFFCTEHQDSCEVMTPTISSIAQEQQGRLTTVAIDVGINKNLPKKYDAGYFEVPVTIYFSGGAEKGRIAGAASREAVEHLIQNPQAFERKVANSDPLEAIPNVPESDFNNQVLKAELPVLVYFYSPGRACEQVSPLVSQIASEHRGRLKVVKVDSYSESQLAAEYDAGDYGVPLLILFADGEARGVLKGTTSITTIQSLIQHPENFPFRDDTLPNVSAILAAIPDLHGPELQDTLKESRLPAVVFFYNDNKDPNCRIAASTIAAAIKPYKSKINLFKMDTSSTREISYKYDSWSGPALVLFKGAKASERKSGIISKDDVRRMLEKAISAK